jgi:hypothetical protein
MRSDARPKEEKVIKVALSVLTNEMLSDLVAFCNTITQYRNSDLHQMAVATLRERAQSG